MKNQKNQRTASQPSTEETSPYSITEEILRERLKKPVYGHMGRQVFACFIACLSSLSFGSCLGWANAVSDDIDDFGSEGISWLVSIILLGCSLGVTVSSFILKQMGPKKALRVFTPIYIIIWWCIVLPNVDIQLAGRFFLGFLGVVYCNTGEILMQHTIHLHIRRYASVITNSCMLLGMLMSRLLSSVTTQFWVTVICAIIPMLHYVLVQIVPESPVFLYAKSHVDAVKALTWYRGEENIYFDMSLIRKDFDVQRLDAEAYRYMMFSRVVYRPLLVIIGVVFFQVTSGYLVFMFYNTEVLTRGRIVFSLALDTGIICCGFIFCALFWGILHTKLAWKIRKILICSCFFSSLFLFGFAALSFCLYHNIASYFSQEGWFAFVCIFFFLFFYHMGLAHIPKTLTFQYLPFQMYQRAYYIVQALYWLFAFFNIFAFSELFHQITLYSYFCALSVIMLIGTIFCYVLLVEPTGKSLIQVQLEFGGNPTGTRGALYNQMRQSL